LPDTPLDRLWAATDEDCGWVGNEAERIVVGPRDIAARRQGQGLFPWMSS
jgi:hypothetical protein